MGSQGKLYKLAPFDRPARRAKPVIFLSSLLCFWFWLLYLYFPFVSSPLSSRPLPRTCPTHTARFFILELPSQFNDRLLRECHSLSAYTDMCPHIANRGLGRPIGPLVSTTWPNGSWYATHQFLAEMVFHARAEGHPCRTWDEREAEMFYVPFYAGLYASSVLRKELSPTERDAMGEELAAHLVQSVRWARRAGADHFLVNGRTGWDFIRSDGGPDFGANRLFLLPEVRNMSVLTVERPLGPTAGNMFGIPYPSYFHPSSAAELTLWQDVALSSRRTHLFAFVGGPRKGIEKAAVRAEILHQCGASPNCLQSKCEPGSSLCHEPSRVMEVMLTAEFCLQPPGDSFTRRSVFDSILAGCIPVFFSEHTAYTQYAWYLPEDPGEYSVIIPRENWGDIETELTHVTRARIEMMRRRVMGLIPRLTYAHPNTSDPDIFDAVDEALRRLTMHVRGRHDMN